MKIIIDTNVLMSRIFFGGVPGQILDVWREGQFELVTSPGVIDEYMRVGERLTRRFDEVDVQPILAFIIQNAEVVADTPLPESVCKDPDDDKFLACALAAGADLIVSGDKALRVVSGYKDIQVVTPRQFLDRLPPDF